MAAAGACAGAGAAGPSGPPAPPPPADAAELEALYRARTDSAMQRFTEAEASFVTRMIGHHAQAIEMAGLAEERSASAEVRTLARRIVGAQEDEIALMRRWLEQRGLPVPDAGGGGTAGHGSAGHDAAPMPGMATPEELRRLEASSGPDFDRLFLTLMIRHHRGAVVMVDELLATAGAAQHPSTFRLAADTAADQTTEIARMEQMLQALDGAAPRR